MVVSQRIPWVYPLSYGEIPDRLIILTFGRVGNSSIVVSQRIPWVYPQSHGEIRDRLIILTFCRVGNSSIVVKLSVLRLDLFLLSSCTGEQNRNDDYWAH